MELKTMDKTIKTIIITAMAIATIACSELEDELARIDEISDDTTMCYQTSGQRLSLSCYTDDIHSCKEDGKSSLGKYDDNATCYDDMRNVLDNYRKSGKIAAGPLSNNYAGGGGNNGGSGGGSIEHCYGSSYQPWDDPQVDTQCQTACVYEASGTTQGVSASCDIISSLGLKKSACPAC